MRDITSKETTWLDVYAMRGITKGTGIIIQNKANVELLVLESDGKPSDSDYDGRVLTYLREVEVDAGSPGVWVRSQFGNVRLFVQESYR